SFSRRTSCCALRPPLPSWPSSRELSPESDRRSSSGLPRWGRGGLGHRFSPPADGAGRAPGALRCLGEGFARRPARSIEVKFAFFRRTFSMLTGSLVAIATPMQKGGALDLAALGRLIDFHVANGTAGIVVVGTTGESPTVDFEEHHKLIRTAVELARGRVPVIAGTGANSTAEAIGLTAYAKEAGAHSALSVVPYYNKPTQEGLYRHFRTIAEEVDLPLILYNVPGRTVADMSNETILRLAQVPGIVGLKDATGDMGRGSELMRALAIA